jgi:hypothetical protein
LNRLPFRPAPNFFGELKRERVFERAVNEFSGLLLINLDGNSPYCVEQAVENRLEILWPQRVDSGRRSTIALPSFEDAKNPAKDRGGLKAHRSGGKRIGL